MSFIKHTTWLLLSLSLTAVSAIAQDAQPAGQPEQSTPAGQAQSEQAPAGEAKQPKPFQLGIEQKDYLPPPTPPPQAYTPQMVPGTPSYAPPPPSQPPLNTGIQQAQMNVLPPQFLGRWQVMGSRSKVEALPQFQGAMDSVFSMRTQNIWNIQGNPQQGYMLSNDMGIQTSLMVQTQGDTAILRYQHPIKNTVAQEAVVMQLLPGGATFQGLERISIVKQGEGVRAKVEYNLMGRRQ